MTLRHWLERWNVDASSRKTSLYIKSTFCRHHLQNSLTSSAEMDDIEATSPPLTPSHQTQYCPHCKQNHPLNDFIGVRGRPVVTELTDIVTELANWRRNVSGYTI